MKRFLEIGLCLLATGCSLPTDVLFRSEESRTAAGGPVFNRVRLVHEGGRDIWMMNQTHEGLALPQAKWERLAIVVDREAKTARFYQLEPGPLEWTEPPKQTEFRVSCTLCHANGPRAIRPVPSDPQTMGAWLETVVWNLRMKRYPRLQSDAAAFESERTVPFRLTGHFANTPLKVAVCVYCHREDGPIARGTLIRQNALAISAMVENGHMPPLGIPLPASQREELNRFLRGL